MMITIESLGTNTGKIIDNSDNYQDVFHLPVTEIMDLFIESGVILFRGFGVTHKQMKEFAQLFSSNLVQDYVRPRVDSDPFVHFVDPGMGECVVHSEHAYSPFRPDVIWFCCGVPAAEDGETIFCDGVQVWENLSEETKQLFIDKKLIFVYESIPFDIFKRFVSPDATMADVQRVLDNLEGVTYQINDDDSIRMEYVCSALVKTKYGHYDAFANSLLPLYQGTGKAYFADGSIISDEAIDEIKKVTDQLIEKIQWQSGDLAMIDNSRFMHGRKAFSDNQRQIFSTLGNLP
ncbi:MAG: TauD/TfdA family dioxygenase [Scytonema sp. PMC 1069.18]|nr:TauD/TfdA family dioxygenase [Scytonema sp. PMC 1069.18]MEC4883843.1 TauD/TfdA family dioxygenase [Scytonema sp. PMC 1070.18]